ncbi:hypothetical protein [Flagellimonas iocasae]|uniref:Universal stress protein n=1 Tax=Flagellimonas iocasae TaxID=2055905 RepID=A0ABW4XVU6_9FLAO
MGIKKVLVPTDFSVNSLELVRKALEGSSTESLEVVLLHGTYLSNSITDLLFFSKSKLIQKLQTKEFVEACTVLRNKYPSKIHALYVDVITSNSNAYFKNYVDASQIEEIIVPHNGFLNFKKVGGINTLPLFKTCDVPCTYVSLSEGIDAQAIEKQQLANVFFSGLK